MITGLLATLLGFVTSNIALSSVAGVLGVSALAYFTSAGSVIAGIADVAVKLFSPLASWLGEIIPKVGNVLYGGAALCLSRGRGTAFVLTLGICCYGGGLAHGVSATKADAKAQAVAELHADYTFVPRPKPKGRFW